MKNEWRESKKLLGGFRCIEHNKTGELTLLSSYGEIWKDDAYTYKAIIYSNRIARRYLPEDQWPAQANDETLIRFPEYDLPLWRERLAIPAKSSSQVVIANSIKSNITELTVENPTLKVKIESKNQNGSNHKAKEDSSFVDPGSENSISPETQKEGGVP